MARRPALSLSSKSLLSELSAHFDMGASLRPARSLRNGGMAEGVAKKWCERVRAAIGDACRGSEDTPK